MTNKNEIPITAASLDQLPVESPLKFDQICRMVGELFINSHQRVSVVEDHARSLLGQLNAELEAAKEENRHLQSQLHNQNTNDPKEEKSGL